MVAITVILAAVIAAFVLDLGGSISEEAQAGVAIDGDGTDEVTVSLQSLGNADGIYIINSEGDYLESDYNFPDTDNDLSDAHGFENVGESVTIDSTTDNVVDGNHNVVAYIGSSPDNADSSTTVTSFEVEGAES